MLLLEANKTELDR